MPPERSDDPCFGRRGSVASPDAFPRLGHCRDESLDLEPGASSPVPRHRDRRPRRAHQAPPLCHRARAAGAPRRRTRHRCLLLITAGDNPERLRSEAAWAHLCGVSPIQASSGKVTRHRLNRGGDRQANERVVAHRHGADRPRSRHEGLCRTPSEGGTHQAGGHPHLEALCRPRGLPTSASRLIPGSGCGSATICRPSRVGFLANRPPAARVFDHVKRVA